MGRRSKGLKRTEIKLNEIFPDWKMKILKPGNDEYIALLTDWKERLKIKEAFVGNIKESFDYKLVGYHHASENQEEIANSLTKAKDSSVNVFCYKPREKDPVFIISILDSKLLNMETYRTIHRFFHYLLIDYKKSGFDCLLTHEDEAWIIRL